MWITTQNKAIFQDFLALSTLCLLLRAHSKKAVEMFEFCLSFVSSQKFLLAFFFCCVDLCIHKMKLLFLSRSSAFQNLFRVKTATANPHTSLKHFKITTKSSIFCLSQNVVVPWFLNKSISSLYAAYHGSRLI